MTQEYKGKSVYKGIALGPVVVFQKNDVQVKREKTQMQKVRSPVCRMRSVHHRNSCRNCMIRQ